MDKGSAHKALVDSAVKSSPQNYVIGERNPGNAMTMLNVERAAIRRPIFNLHLLGLWAIKISLSSPQSTSELALSVHYSGIPVLAVSSYTTP